MEIKFLDLEHIDVVIQYENLYLGSSLGRDYIINDINNNPYARYLMAIEQGELIGYIGINVDTFGEILNLFVIESQRNQGVAKALLNEALYYAKKAGSESISLEVKETNIAAIELYRLFGFEASHKRKGYYNGVDAILMIKKLR